MIANTALNSILAPGGLTLTFQPILEIDRAGQRRVHALECLTRGPRGTNMEQAGVLFEYARRKHAEVAVDLACIELALASAEELENGMDLAVNIHAATLASSSALPAYLRCAAVEHGIDLQRVILEVVEHSPAWCFPHFGQAVTELRRMGVRIALDDVGIVQSTYKMMLISRPDYLKLDRSLISGLHRDPGRKGIVESLVLLASRLGARVTAEGIEDEADLAAVAQLNINLVQGYLFARPSPLSELAATCWLATHPAPGPRAVPRETLIVDAQSLGLRGRGNLSPRGPRENGAAPAAQA
jgi:EAL domain-containing protein (putative c-di-GMP-specific phosphodiesterase class I)